MRDYDGKCSPEYRVLILKELGDCLWYLAEIAYELDTTLEEVAKMNIRKLLERKNKGKIGGSGDEREKTYSAKEIADHMMSEIHNNISGIDVSESLFDAISEACHSAKETTECIFSEKDINHEDN